MPLLSAVLNIPSGLVAMYEGTTLGSSFFPFLENRSCCHSELYVYYQRDHNHRRLPDTKAIAIMILSDGGNRRVLVTGPFGTVGMSVPAHHQSDKARDRTRADHMRRPTD